MTNTPSSRFNAATAVYGADVGRETMELISAIADLNPVYQFYVGKTNHITSDQIADLFEIILEEHNLNNDCRRYRELGRHSGTIAEYDDHVLFMDCVQRGDGPGYLEITLFIKSVRKKSTLADTLRTRLRAYISDPWDEIEWITASGGHFSESTFPIKKYDPIMSEVYPFIPNVEEWTERYLKSKSNVLILNGPMGTGKSSLIAHIIRVGKLKSMTAFDSKVMKDDYLYTKFITEEYGLIVLEDADLLLLKRVEGENDTMSKLLNVSEGLIDTSNKKIIFTANLGNIVDIDPALKRPGRCFDIIEFRALTALEANSARAKMGKTLFKPDREYTLAQVYQ